MVDEAVVKVATLLDKCSNSRVGSGEGKDAVGEVAERRVWICIRREAQDSRITHRGKGIAQTGHREGPLLPARR